MRRRLLVVYVSLLTVAIAGLAVPLAVSIAIHNTRDVFIDRQDDTNRFASFADPALSTGQTALLGIRLANYDELFGITAVVVNRDGRLVVSSRTDPNLRDPEVRTALRAALAGEGTAADRVVWPWQTSPLVVAAPVGRGGEIIGAVVTMSPVDHLRATTFTGWLSVAGFVLLAALVAAYTARRLTGWMLRPVRDLDDTTHEIAAGRLAARVSGAEGPTELRRLATSFNTMIDTVEGMLERRRVFASYASHQLRNPLTALRLRVENLAAHLDRAGEEDHVLALDEVDRLAWICDGLLAVARAESGRQVPAVVVDAARVADARVAAWQPVAGRSGVSLARSGPEPGSGAAAARAQDGVLDQVLDVLLDNAIKFAGPGATVVTTVGTRDGRVLVDVVDDGPGLPAEALTEATRPYWRSPAHAEHAGSGLGLAIVATLVETCGGELELRSATPHGLHAGLSLPAAEPLTASPPGSSAPPPDAAGADRCPPPPGDPGTAPPDEPPPASVWTRTTAG